MHEKRSTPRESCVFVDTRASLSRNPTGGLQDTSKIRRAHREGWPCRNPWCSLLGETKSSDRSGFDAAHAAGKSIVVSRLDKEAEAVLLASSPTWLTELTSFPTDQRTDAADKRRATATRPTIRHQ